jgi:hypothetical protein
VLGGAMGIGKDTLLEPVKLAVGPWNFSEVSPHHLMGRFNGFLKCVILRISEARDLGDINRYQFYDHLKVIIAAPPDVLRIDEKHLREHSIPNCCGVIITTNYKKPMASTSRLRIAVTLSLGQTSSRKTSQPSTGAGSIAGTTMMAATST